MQLIPKESAFANAMLHCKISACKRYLDAGLRNLVDEAARQQPPDIWHISRHVLFGQPSFMARLRPASLSGDFPSYFALSRQRAGMRGNLRLRNEIDTRRRLGAAPLGGLIAIVVNTILLEAADWIRSSPPAAACSSFGCLSPLCPVADITATIELDGLRQKPTIR
jgi:hypothetical protein